MRMFAQEPAFYRQARVDETDDPVSSSSVSK